MSYNAISDHHNIFYRWLEEHSDIVVVHPIVNPGGCTLLYIGNISTEFTYRLDRLKPRASKLRGSPAKVYNTFDTVIGLSYLCCHNPLYSLNNPSAICLAQLHYISEYCRNANTPHHPHLYSNNIPSFSSREGGVLGGTSRNSLGHFFI